MAQSLLQIYFVIIAIIVLLSTIVLGALIKVEQRKFRWCFHFQSHNQKANHKLVLKFVTVNSSNFWIILTENLHGKLYTVFQQLSNEKIELDKLQGLSRKFIDHHK